MLVGPSSSVKSSACLVLLKSLERLEGTEGVAHVIDPKAISKEAFFGLLDPNTLQWTDGLFTGILRKFIDNVPEEINKRHWIIFDGDVDPEWVETLDSVLDDKKLFLSLPNGERHSIPPNVRIIFEVQELKYAHCGTVSFSEVSTPEIILKHYLACLRHVPLEEGEEGTVRTPSETIQVQQDVADILQLHFSPDGLVVRSLEHAAELIVDFTRFRALDDLFSMLNKSVRRILNYNHAHMDFPMQSDQLESYIPKALLYAILWSFAGDGKFKGE
uniref:Uncharacterized protein n=1 Tax=Daphnia galeata TaxID=27404 RepID=A0A8J2RS10_9CRUS|nr:unnamed protein product [Daphnia galeata]